MTQATPSFASRLRSLYGRHTKGSTSLVPFLRPSVVPLQSTSQRKRRMIVVKRLDGPNIPVANLKPTMAARKRYKSTFRRTFGLLGVPLLLVICVSIAWTTWLIILNINPNATANYLMDTADFDDGGFWLIIDPDPAFLVLTCCGLGVVLLGYLCAFAKMTVLRICTHQVRVRPSSLEAQSLATRSAHKMLGKDAVTSWNTLTGFNGKYRKLWNLFLKLVDVAFQLVTLDQILEAGFPVILCYTYSALVSANCLSCVFVILNHARLTAFGEVLIDTFFDMILAVGAPIVLIVYSYYNFQFDREGFLVAVEVANEGNFERQARISADPEEVNLFLLNLNALRITTALDFCLRVGMNLSFAYRLKRIIEVTAEQVTVNNSSKNFRFFEAKRSTAVVAQKSVSKWATLPFLVISCMLLVYTDRCISFSRSVCEQYSECAAYAHRATNRQHLCPCLVFIDVKRAPKTYDEWINLPDATGKLKLLAASGDLRVVEVINRLLVELPDELHKCKHLRHISLIHSCTESIPVWAKDFEKLEFLNIEGKADELNLVHIPDDLFSKMNSLTFVHLGVHHSLQRMPFFEGLGNLKSLTLALLTSLQELPSLEPLKNLERLELLFLSQIQDITGLAIRTDLSHLVILDTAICCNGMLGTCDHDERICSNATCSTNGGLRSSIATQQLLTQFNRTVCPAFIGDSDLLKTPTKERIDVCEGVMFRQCAFSANKTGICYSDRIQVIACSYSPVAEEIRRRQILRRVGTPCDPVEEEWLGCSKG